ATATARAAEGTGIAVRPIRCLANCNRGLSAAVRRDGAWTYVFGNLDPSSAADALIEGAKLFAGAPDGLTPWRGRPDALKPGLVARTPPLDFAGDCRRSNRPPVCLAQSSRAFFAPASPGTTASALAPRRPDSR